MNAQCIDKGIEHMKKTKSNISHINDGTAFRLANHILEKWYCSTNEKREILGLTRDSFHHFIKGDESEELSSEQLQRISYIVNIHQSLKVIFSSEENAYGFMNMKNNNPYFNNKTPISLISNGSIDTLHEASKRINAMRNV